MTRRRATAEAWNGQQLMEHAPKRMRVESEASVLTRVLKALKACPNIAVRRNRIGYDKRAHRPYGGGTGSSDIECTVGPYGRICWIETKRSDGGVVSPEQETFMANERALGAVAGVVSTPEEALALIEEARRPPEDT